MFVLAIVLLKEYIVLSVRNYFGLNGAIRSVILAGILLLRSGGGGWGWQTYK